MPGAWICAALLCLCTPWVWYQYGWLPAGLVGLPLLVIFYKKKGNLAFLGLLLVSLLVRLEVERSHVLDRHWQHQQAQLEVCLHRPARDYEHYQLAVAEVTRQPSELSLRRLRFTASSGVPLAAGDCLTGTFRLRQPLGQEIPGQFSPARYYFTERIDALATLVELDSRRVQSDAATWFYHRSAGHFTHNESRAVWAALSLGWASALPASLAELFNQTQIRHLLVVSGMHVGMVAVWAWALLPWVLLLPGLRRLPFAWLRLFWVAGASGAFVALTGFGYPGIRAWIMLSVPLSLMAAGWRINSLQLLAMAAAALTLFQPQAWLATGAWLSFGLVWVLLSLASRWRDQGIARWKLAVGSQLYISLFMIPVSSLFGFYLHPLGVLINLVLIPLVTLVILPWSLLILVFSDRAALTLYDHWLAAGLDSLGQIAHWYQPAPYLDWLALAVFSFILWLLFSQWFVREQRWLLLPLALMLLLTAARERPPDELRMTVFDVGHGQAILLQWPDQTWLYDAAGQWGDGQSLAEQRLQPWLRKHRVQLDGMVISHSDLDHAGGAAWFAGQWPAARRWTGEPDALAQLSGQLGWRNCHLDQADINLPFEFLSVPAVLRDSANDRSCLVWIPTSAGPVLITGDASRRIEYWLLQEDSGRFPLAAMVLGHHGSPTSSARAFLEASPDALLMVSSASRSRPRWPSTDLLDYLSGQGRTLNNTAQLGTFQVAISDGQVRIIDWQPEFRRLLLEN